MWLEDDGTKMRAMMRPDRFGVMFALKPESKLSDGNYVMAAEVWPGAFGEPEAERTIRRFARARVVALLHHGDRKSVLKGEKRKVEEAIPILFSQ